MFEAQITISNSSAFRCLDIWRDGLEAPCFLASAVPVPGVALNSVKKTCKYIYKYFINEK